MPEKRVGRSTVQANGWGVLVQNNCFVLFVVSTLAKGINVLTTSSDQNFPNNINR
jgi:hypothetical protein